MPSEWRQHRDRLTSTEKRLGEVYNALGVVERSYRDSHPPFAASVEESMRVTLSLGRAVVQLRELIMILPSVEQYPRSPMPGSEISDRDPGEE